MSDESRAPVEVDQIEYATLGRAKIAVRVTGRWQGRRRLPDARAFLVIDAEGRRHRFPAMPEPRRPRIGRPGAWAATFALPSWLESHLGEKMTLWLGNVELPLPGPSYVAQLPDVPADAQTAEIDETPDGNGNGAQPAVAVEQAVAELASAVASAPGPLQPSEPAPKQGRMRMGTEAAEVQATVDALRAELRDRAATEARLRGTLAGAKAELESRSERQTALEAAQSELRDQMAELLGLVEAEGAQRTEIESRAVVLASEVAELRAELVRSEVAREAAVGEAAGLRDELDRMGDELTRARGSNNVDAGLSEARSLLEEARAATARLRGVG